MISLNVRSRDRQCAASLKASKALCDTSFDKSLRQVRIGDANLGILSLGTLVPRDFPCPAKPEFSLHELSRD